MTITYQQEFLCSIPETEFKGLTENHWQEIALNKDKVPLDPDMDMYYQKEINKELALFTVRDDGKLVGYFLVFLYYHPHYKSTYMAQNDIIYISPEYRKGFVGIKLIKFAEKCLKEDGVKVLHINTKFHKDFSLVLERLGFNPVEKVYGKYLGD